MRQELGRPGKLPPVRLRGRNAFFDAADGEMLVGVVIGVQRHADLPQIVLALRPPRRFARRLHGRQQHRHQHADDRDDDQQFDEREAASRDTRDVEYRHAWRLDLRRCATALCGEARQCRTSTHWQSQWHPQRLEDQNARGSRPSRPIRMPRVGRSSDSRAVAKQAFSFAAGEIMASIRMLRDCARLQRRGRPGFAPGSLFVGSQNKATDHQRTLTARTIAAKKREVKPRAKRIP